jgi:phosphopentomutase
MRRAFVVVLDACGVGALPDAADYGDAGTDTLGHLAEVEGGLRLPALEALGLGCVAPLRGVREAEQPVLHGRLHALGPGKDSTAGHWELMGVVVSAPPPTYPEGFPVEVLDLIAKLSGREVLCNRPCNGIEAIERFGHKQLEGGGLILYTSQDSVLQIAAHEDVIRPDELYELCAGVRRGLPPEHAVGRVIARPFTGRAGAFSRTEGRRDFSLPPPARSYLEEIQEAGAEVHTVGKAGQLFTAFGVDVQHPGATNQKAIDETTALIEELEHGLVFTNLIETDQIYGHRHDAAGFHRSLQHIDGAVAGWLERLGGDDMLILTADHGCDVTAAHTDHTREHVPLLACFDGHRSRRHDGPMSDVGASALDWICGRSTDSLPGRSFVSG